MSNSRSASIGAVFSSLLVFILLVQFESVATQSVTNEPTRALPSLEFGGLLQQQFIADDAPDSPARFAIHLARVGVGGRHH